MRVAFVLAVLLAGCVASPGPGDGELPARLARSAAEGDGGDEAWEEPSCGHTHATFAVFLSTGGPAHRVDFASPKAPGGGAYYDFASGLVGTLALHMHLAGGEGENGEQARAQWHMESPRGEPCPTLAEALRIVEVEASASGLELTGGHEQVPGQSGTFRATADQPLRIRTTCSGCDGWREAAVQDQLATRLAGGDRVLVLLGSYSDEQVGSFQALVPQPIGADEP